MGILERGLSPADQILSRGTKPLEKAPTKLRLRDPEALRGKAFLFPENSLVTYSLDSGAVHMKRYGLGKRKESGEIEVPIDWPQSMDIETAVASTLHIADEYALEGGEMTNKDLKALHHALDLLGWLRTNHITENELLQQEAETEVILEELGYRRVRDLYKKKAAQMMDKATSKDSMNRVNTPKSEAQASSAVVALKHRTNINHRVFEKYGVQLSNSLVKERSEERHLVKRAVIEMDELLKLSPYYSTYRRKVVEFADKLPSLLGHGVMKVAPYRIPALQTLISFLGISDREHFQAMHKVFGDELANLIPASTLYDIANVASLYPRTIKDDFIDPQLTRARDNLKLALALGEEKMEEELDKRRERLSQAT